MLLSDYRRDFGILWGLILVMWLCLYWPVLWGSEVLFFRDIGHTYYPFHAFLKESIWGGELPLWNPYSFTGTPQIAAAEPAVFYPGTWLFFVLDFQRALILGLLFHQWLLAAGMYLLGRTYQWRSLSALCAALIISSSGLLVSMNNLHPLFFTYAWCPLLWVLLHRLMDDPHAKNIALLAFAYGFQILTGHLDIVYYNSLFLLGYALLWAYRKPWRAWGGLAIALLGGICLASIQLWPTLEYFRFSVRSQGLALDTVQDWSLHPVRLLSLGIPQFLGDLYQGKGLIILGEPRHGFTFLFANIYLGASWFGLAMLGGLSGQWWKSRFGKFWCLTGLVTLGVAFGKFLPMYAFLHRFLPGFSVFRYPVKLFFFVACAAALLAGFGMERLQERAEWKVLSGIVLGFVFTLGGLWVFPGPLQEGLYQAIQKSGATMDTRLFNPWFQDYYQSLMTHLLWALVAILGVLGCVLGVIKGKKAALWGIPVCLFLDLFFNGQALVWTTTPSFYSASQPELAFSKRVKPDQSLRYLEGSSIRQPVPKAFHRFPGIMMSSAYLNRSFLMSQHLLGPFQNVYPEWAAKPLKLSVLHHNYTRDFSQASFFRQRFENLVAAQYILDVNNGPEVASHLKNHPDIYQFEATFPDIQTTLWKNKKALDRAHFKYQSAALDSEEQVLDALVAKSSGFDPLQHVLLLKNPQYEQALSEVPSSEAQEKKWTPPQIVEESLTHLKIRFETNTSGYLVLADTYYPGWKVYDNGEERPVLQANYIQRAVRVGPGEHQIEFRYRPLSVYGGAVMSLIATGLLLIFGWRSRKNQQSPV